MKPLIYLAGVLTALGIGGLSESARAIALPLDGKWQAIQETKADQDAVPVFEQVLSFESKIQVKLTIVDLYVSGDRIELFNNLVSLGETVAGDGSNPGDHLIDPEKALVASNYSKRMWILEPGSYNLTFATTQRPLGTAYEKAAGGFAIRAVVPEGGSGVAWLGAVFGGLAGWRQWTRRGR